MEQPIFCWQQGKLIKENKTILSIEEFKLDKGEVRGLIGPNGAGKTSLLKVVGLLEKSHSGQVFFGGEQISYKKNLIAYRRKISVLFQEQLFVQGTVYENVILPLTYRKENKSSAREKVIFWLEKLGIQHLKDRPVSKISGGEGQRAALARALVTEPELLLLDEPLVGLDNEIKRQFICDLKQIAEETNLSMLYVSHDYGELSYLCDQITALIEGKIVQTDSPEELALKPNHQKITQLIGSDRLFPGTVVGEEGKQWI
jgi:tungstate transport system ATP-binding protein